MTSSTPHRISFGILMILLFAALAISGTSCSAIKARNSSPQGASDSADQKSDEPMLFAITVGERGGYIDSSGKVVVEPQFERTDDFAEGLGRICVGKMYGFIDSSGKIVIEPKYNNANDFSEGLAAVCEGIPWSDTGRWGFIDKEGIYVIEPQFGHVSDFHEGLASATIKTVGVSKSPGRDNPWAPHWGFIDQKGNFVIKPEYTWVQDFSEDVAAVLIATKLGFIDKTGAIAIQPQYTVANRFSQGLAVVCVGDVGKGGKWGYIDKTGTMVIDAKYDLAYDFSEGLAPVRILADEKYTDITGVSHYLTEGAHDMKGIRGRWAYIDRTGQIVIEPKFDGARPFSDGLAAVCMGNPFNDKGKWGFIDTSGNYVMDPQFKYVGDFTHGLAIAGLEEWDGYIDKSGAYVWSTVHTEPILPSSSEDFGRHHTEGYPRVP
jgi:hypothetical protein